MFCLTFRFCVFLVINLFGSKGSQVVEHLKNIEQTQVCAQVTACRMVLWHAETFTMPFRNAVHPQAITNTLKHLFSDDHPTHKPRPATDRPDGRYPEAERACECLKILVADEWLAYVFGRRQMQRNLPEPRPEP